MSDAPTIGWQQGVVFAGQLLILALVWIMVGWAVDWAGLADYRLVAEAPTLFGALTFSENVLRRLWPALQA